MCEELDEENEGFSKESELLDIFGGRFNSDDVDDENGGLLLIDDLFSDEEDGVCGGI